MGRKGELEREDLMEYQVGRVLLETKEGREVKERLVAPVNPVSPDLLVRLVD